MCEWGWPCAHVVPVPQLPFRQVLHSGASPSARILHRVAATPGDLPWMLGPLLPQWSSFDRLRISSWFPLC